MTANFKVITFCLALTSVIPTIIIAKQVPLKTTKSNILCVSPAAELSPVEGFSNEGVKEFKSQLNKAKASWVKIQKIVKTDIFMTYGFSRGEAEYWLRDFEKMNANNVLRDKYQIQNSNFFECSMELANAIDYQRTWAMDIMQGKSSADDFKKEITKSFKLLSQVK